MIAGASARVCALAEKLLGACDEALADGVPLEDVAVAALFAYAALVARGSGAAVDDVIAQIGRAMHNCAALDALAALADADAPGGKDPPS